MNKLLSICCLFALVAVSCYSFKGGSIPPEVKSVSIRNFINESQNGNTALSQDLTDRLRNKFLNETRLSLADNGDWIFEGRVTGYVVSSQAPSGDNATALGRLTIRTKMKFTDRLNEKNSWEQSFSAFADYDISQVLADVEDGLLEDINEQIIVDIFNRATTNW